PADPGNDGLAPLVRKLRPRAGRHLRGAGRDRAFRGDRATPRAYARATARARGGTSQGRGGGRGGGAKGKCRGLSTLLAGALLPRAAHPRRYREGDPALSAGDPRRPWLR